MIMGMNRPQPSEKPHPLSDEEVRDFASRLSHDLGAPLRTLRGFGQLLQRRVGSQLDSHARELLDLVLADGLRAEQMPAGSVEWLRAGLASPVAEELRRRDRSQALHSVVESFSSRLGQVRGQVSVKGMPLLPGTDADWVRIFGALLSNAIQFRDSARPFKVELRGGDGWFEIEDNGIGLPPEADAERAFGLFSRLHDPTRCDGVGLGVGLALCDRWIQSRRGTIRFVGHAVTGQSVGVTLRIEWS